MTASSVVSAPRRRRVPVFMLPRDSSLGTIQEDEEIYGGFFVRVVPTSSSPSTKNQQPPPRRKHDDDDDRVFLGLESLVEDDRFFHSEASSEMTTTTTITDNVDYRFYSFRLSKSLDAKRRKRVISEIKHAIRHKSKETATGGILPPQ